MTSPQTSAYVGSSPIRLKDFTDVVDRFLNPQIGANTTSRQTPSPLNLSLGSIQNVSMGTFPSSDDKSRWEEYLDFPEKIQRKGRAFLRRHQGRVKMPPTESICAGFYHCLGVEEPRNNVKKHPPASSRKPKTEDTEIVDVPSYESSSVSSYTSHRSERDSNMPEYVVCYKPKTCTLREDEELEVVWRNECLDFQTDLVLWSGTLENPKRGPSSHCNDDSSLEMVHEDVPQDIPDDEVGWITCYHIDREVSAAALTASKDPVLHYFCQRFGLESVKPTSHRNLSVAPPQLDNEELFHPYGTQASQEELQRRLTLGYAPDGSVLELTDILLGMPIFFISDLFVSPDRRGYGLGLVLLDRALTRVADSLCLVVVFMQDYTDERLPHYLGLLGFSYLAPGFLMRRNGHGRRPPNVEEVCPFLPRGLLHPGTSSYSAGNV